MQRFLNIDKYALQKVEKLIAFNPEYNLRGWIREAIEELIESEELIKESDLTQFKSPYSRLGFSFEIEFWERFDKSVRRLKAIKKCVSRNVLVNQAISRKIRNSEEIIEGGIRRKRSFYQERLPLKGRKIKVDLRLPPEVLEELKQQVERKRKRNVGYSISDWLNEAVRRLLFVQEDEIFDEQTNNHIFSNERKRTAVYLDIELLKQIDSKISGQKRKKKKISRTTWLQKATMLHLSLEKG